MKVRDFIEAISIYPDDMDMVVVVDNLTNHHMVDMPVRYFECSQESNTCELHCCFIEHKRGNHE